MKKRIFAIIGSASRQSVNLQIVQHLSKTWNDYFVITIWNELRTLPHFDPDSSAENPPQQVDAFRKAIEKADGILICTPEYVFSVPSGLKNAIEWCVARMVFCDKPCVLITASTSGIKGHDELQLIMKTLMAKFTDDTIMLIQGVKGKIDNQGNIVDSNTADSFVKMAEAFNAMIEQERTD